MNSIYLDNSTTTRPSDASLSKMMSFHTDMWGIPTMPHQKGQELFPALGESYRAIYSLLGASEEDDFVLASSGAEAINHVIFSTYRDISQSTGKNHYITSNADEAPTIMSIARLEKFGCLGKILSVNSNGIITPETIAEAITPRTALVSLSWANGLTGTVQPVAEIGDLCRQRGILFHIDATHVLGKLLYDLEDIGANFLTLNGDHLHAPKGTGGIYIKNKTKCSPFIVGGNDQSGYRAAPLNVPGLAALGYAAQEMLDARDLLCTEIARFRDKLEEGIVSGFPDAIPLFRNLERLPNCTAIGFPGIFNEALLFMLNRKGVYASIGGGNYQQIAILLSSCGIDEITANSAISFSLSRYTTESEIDRAIEIIVDSAKKLRKTSQHMV